MKEKEINLKKPRIKRTFYSIVVKRFLDVTLSGVGLFLLSPVMLVVAIGAAVTQGLPVFYRQERPGFKGKPFYIYKFRSMINATEDKNGNEIQSDKRVTQFGRFIRKWSLDELPELWCILKGDMSIIGPRPLLPEYNKLYNKRHKYRLAIKPGLTLPKIKRGGTWTWNDQFENDIYYLEHVSFLLDVRMFFRTIQEVIDPEDYRVNATRQAFNGDNLFMDV